MQVLTSGAALGESPRWHDGRLWYADWPTGRILAVSLDGTVEVAVTVDTFPFCLDWLPDGRMLVVSGGDGRLLRRELDGSLVTHADLAGLADPPWNDIVVDGRGNAYVGGIGFDFPGGEVRPGVLALVTPDGTVRTVADQVLFPNGIAVTPDNGTLILAESYGNRLTAWDVAADGGLSGRRVWAALGDGVPDGICLDAEGAVWYADVPNRRCVRVREGGEVLRTVPLDRGGFACALGGPAGRTLFVVTNEWTGTEEAGSGATGQVLAVEVDVPGAGWP